jgi:hypothetical protein
LGHVLYQQGLLVFFLVPLYIFVFGFKFYFVALLIPYY